MDAAVIALLVVIAAIVGAMLFARPTKVLPLEELLTRLSSIQADPQLTAAQKLHLAEIAYHGFESSIVSIVGGVHDVFPAASIVMKTTSRELPLIGVELARVSPEQLRAFDKGKAVTLRVKLPGWSRYSDVVGLPVAFRDARLFYAGQWYGVKGTYRVRDPSEPKTGEFLALSRSGELTGLQKTGEFKAYRPNDKTVEVKLPKPDDPSKRNQ
jgi:hypothetical protein